ncbi:hypothetical protein ACVRWQ_04030 [Streptococcus phocae subsp. salmonis]|nr:hypothetical protein [Streptococcus phocae]
MEMISRPSQEVITFSKIIRRWIVSDETIGGKEKFIFREDTPTDV